MKYKKQAQVRTARLQDHSLARVHGGSDQTLTMETPEEPLSEAEIQKRMHDLAMDIIRSMKG